eukprot:19221-Heterococcus_DN1.PRE.6
MPLAQSFSAGLACTGNCRCTDCMNGPDAAHHTVKKAHTVNKSQQQQQQQQPRATKQQSTKAAAAAAATAAGAESPVEAVVGSGYSSSSYSSSQDGDERTDPLSWQQFDNLLVQTQASLQHEQQQQQRSSANNFNTDSPNCNYFNSSYSHELNNSSSSSSGNSSSGGVRSRRQSRNDSFVSHCNMPALLSAAALYNNSSNNGRGSSPHSSSSGNASHDNSHYTSKAASAESAGTATAGVADSASSSSSKYYTEQQLHGGASPSATGCSTDSGSVAALEVVAVVWLMCEQLLRLASAASKAPQLAGELTVLSIIIKFSVLLCCYADRYTSVTQRTIQECYTLLAVCCRPLCVVAVVTTTCAAVVELYVCSHKCGVSATHASCSRSKRCSSSWTRSTAAPNTTAAAAATRWQS